MGKNTDEGQVGLAIPFCKLQSLLMVMEAALLGSMNYCSMFLKQRQAQ
jgi:hypothetical protein